MKKIEKIIDTYDSIASAFIILLTAIFGKYYYIFVAYVFLNIIDYTTGLYKAKKLKKVSSQVGLAGIIKKISYWFIIAVAFLISTTLIHILKDTLDVELSALHLIGWFTLISLTINEIRSIFENLVEANINVPNFLVRSLAITEKIVNSRIDKTIDDIEKNIDITEKTENKKNEKRSIK